MSQSTKSRSRSKPAKPYADFPLFPHATGRWAKKIRGKLHYFGPWDDPNGALQRYLDQRDDLHAGRTPRAARDGLSVRELVNRFLTVKQHLLDTGEIATRTFQDYYATCERIIETFGKSRLVEDLAPDDFESLRATIAQSHGPVALGNEIQRIRTLFKYAYDAGLVEKPIRHGPTFKRPSKKILRQARQANGPRMFEAAELRLILQKAGTPLRAMVLLGINCGFGQSDLAGITRPTLDLKSGFIDYPRPKTAILRRCPLWPETIEAVQDTLKNRPQSKFEVDADLVFITKYGQRWVRISAGTKRAWTDSIGLQFGKLLKSLDLKRKGLNFYALRHTFETIAGESRDQVAVDHVMGHARDDMASVYRERISDERLRTVTTTVRDWLFPPEKPKPTA